MRRETKLAASGKWLGLLVAAGLDQSTLSGKHQSCPLCGGTDRFRFTNVNNGGEYFCSGCGPGDGFNLIAGINGYGFREAAKEVDRLLGNGDIKETFQPAVDIEKRRRDLNKVWAGATYPSVVMAYLQGRGISLDLPADLRGHPDLYNSDTGSGQPGMVALIRNKKGEPVSIHRTFFDPKAKKIMPPTEKIVGGSVFLENKEAPEHDVVVGEGIETTLMGSIRLQCHGMAAISAHGMETIELPRHFSTVGILADNDASFTGQKAAFTLARRLDQEGRRVHVIMSPEPGYDFLDMDLKGYDNAWMWHNEP